jgi:Protein of unknown function (DUF3606)
MLLAAPWFGEKNVKMKSIDRNRVFLSEPHEIRYRAQALGLSKEELEQVIHKVGRSLPAVLEQLGK